MSKDIFSTNKRIAKNTLLLYVRMLFTMAVGLFTSRVVLSALGIEDYGVYNVVAGVVSMFHLFTSSLSSAISRFLTFELGKGNKERLSEVFSTSVSIQLGIAFVIVILCELLGVWFLNTHLNIPESRLEAANWVIQMSILTFVINLISVPYNAAIIAHERMSVFAYISIFEVTLKLVIVYMLYVSPYDKLVTYSILLSVVALLIRIVYGFYCSRNFTECHYRFSYNRTLLKEMTCFAGWNFFGSGAYLFNTQGVNIVTNLYFGVAVNAARGVTNQAGGVIKQFVSNFTTAINPQITKSYAAGNLDYTFSLICRSSKFCYLLMLFFFVPFMFEAETIMMLWLNNYPPDAPLFLRLSIFGTMIDLLGNSPAIAAWATGNIKRYYIYVTAVGCLVFPLSWFAFSLGCPAYTSYVIFIITYLFVLAVKLYVIKGLLKFPIRKYINDVVSKVVLATIVAFVLPTVAFNLLSHTLLNSFVIIFMSLASVAVTIYFFGLSSSERDSISNLVLNKIKNFK